MTGTPDEAGEQALVDAARKDPARFLELYDRHFHRVYVYALRRTGSRAEAEDVTSAVFGRALANLDKFEWRGVPFVAWLYRIAANELADRRRQSARFVSAPASDAPGPDSDLEWQVALFELVDRLPEDQRRVIQLRFGEGRSIREVAAALVRSEGAVKQLQRRAVEKLRADLERTDG